MSESNSYTYKQGHHRTVTRNHARRTAEVEGAFILPHLKSNFTILDIGCGPGSITTGFAKYVSEGTVTGVDITDEVLEQAREYVSSQDPKPQNVTFELGNVLEGLKYGDASFDVVFCNQVLLHIPEPVKALKEMRRVLKPGGFFACRESDMPFRWYPYPPGIQLSDKGGSMMHVFAREAGFEPKKMAKGAGAEVHAGEEEARFFGLHMLGRVEGSTEQYKALGATDQEIDLMKRDLKAWAEDVDAWFAILQAELICWK
ncbi:S-adenosyl-L-methionine-dependent methyltransferase [Lophiotrema nucula]|uniref:S-adenosyl-L-methionine-dependent methyltransferase n=1 Tax=Lophiotrema nucula TaxID=690887 RepID=A0A6A5ZCD4_9PLEO|nr:S-adenosyl-L-methionine-dependent methyltransferase [Lophiotrema nucula]